MRGAFLVGAVLIFSVPVHAAGISQGLIKGYLLNKQSNDRVGLFITPDGSISNRAACNVTNRFVVDASTPFGQSVLASILSAIVSGEELRLFGDGTCGSGLSTNSETLVKVCTPQSVC